MSSFILSVCLIHSVLVVEHTCIQIMQCFISHMPVHLLASADFKNSCN